MKLNHIRRLERIKMLNKQKGNMYGFVTHTWNPIKGKCSHDCKYCYMKVWKQKPLRLVEKELGDDLGEGNFIFVGSSTDMFADDVPIEWIERTLQHCRKYNNTYLFQTKNPERFPEFRTHFPKDSIWGITLETNRDIYEYSQSSSPFVRFDQFVIFETYDFVKRIMVTIEPIMDFDLEQFIMMIKNIRPEWVNIGADSKGHKLPEPSKEKIEALIKELGKFTEVRLKPNLKRIYTSNTELKKEGENGNKNNT